MEKNQMRMICNPDSGKMSYYLKNEMGQWEILLGDSPLSRNEFKRISIMNDEGASRILKKIDEVYNCKNRGVDIIFEGTMDAYLNLKKTIESETFADKNISCKVGTTKIVVVGKRASGKTSLIKGLEKLKKFDYEEETCPEYIKYRDDYNHAEWYEVKGIDLGKKYVDNALETVERLSKEEGVVVIYCISADTGKIESIENDFINTLKKKLSDMRIIIALTKCYRDDAKKVVEEIEKIAQTIKVVPILAQNYVTKRKNSVESFGLEELLNAIFEGR